MFHTIGQAGRFLSRQRENGKAWPFFMRFPKLGGGVLLPKDRRWPYLGPAKEKPSWRLDPVCSVKTSRWWAGRCGYTSDPLRFSVCTPIGGQLQERISTKSVEFWTVLNVLSVLRTLLPCIPLSCCVSCSNLVDARTRQVRKPAKKDFVFSHRAPAVGYSGLDESVPPTAGRS